MSKQIIAIAVLIINTLATFAGLPQLTKGANLIKGPVEEVLIITPGFDYKKLTFDPKGRLIKYSDFKREETFQWKDNGILTNSYGAQYYYQENGDTLKYWGDETVITQNIYDHKTGEMTKQIISSPDMDFSTEVQKDSYSTVLTRRKNGEFYFYISQTALSTDSYGNPLVSAITSSEGKGWQAFTFYKYFNRQYTATTGEGDADDFLYKALYNIYIKKSYDKGMTLLDQAANGYKITNANYGVSDCQAEKIALYCKKDDPATALSLLKTFHPINKDKDITLYTTIADAYKSQNNHEASDSLNTLALNKMLTRNKDYLNGGFFPEEVRQLFFKLYDDYMSRGEYAKAVKTTQWQLKEMDSFGLKINNLDYQRAIAYHIDASYALNPQFVSLAEKCEKLVDHLNSFPIETLSTHPTLQSELISATKYCIVADRWSDANKFLNAHMKRYYVRYQELIDFFTLNGRLNKLIGENILSFACYLQALDECKSLNQKTEPVLGLAEHLFRYKTIPPIDTYLSPVIEFIDNVAKGNLDNAQLRGYWFLIMAYMLEYDKSELCDIVPYYKTAIESFELSHNNYMANLTSIELANLYADSDKNYIADRYYHEALQSGTVLSGSSLYFDLLNKRGMVNDKLKRHQQADECYKKAIDILRQRIKRTFIFLTERQREGFWAQQQPLFKALAHDSGNSRGELRYNAALLNKNLLLSSASRLRGIVEASGDEALIADFRRLRDAVGMGVPADSIEALERSIQSRSEAYGSYTSAVDIDMKSVQSVLAANECAIEIVPSMRDSISGYDALVLSHEGVSVVPLFTENEITAALSGDIYDKSSKFGQSLWQKLSKAIGKSRRIYISPDGPFHSIAFEYLSVDGKHRANEVYDISRVSSTREICLGAQKRAIDGGALFGGIDYNLDSEDKQLALEEAGLVRGHVGENLGKDVMPWLFLPGTLGEVRAIDKSLEKAGKHSRLFTSDLALEEAFYSLSGKSPSILHIATHGFYLPQYQGANPLSKTGLVMAGANHYWREGWNLAPEPHDGILTGTEIAGLDLGNTDLVVLSACQSGLGDVSAEGVFGLPRAFKKSGAGSILMSLWPVHDDATRLLMDEFYKSLLSGKTKQQSLLDAQAAVKRAKFTTPSGTRESGSNPKYWAAFVLLD